MISLSWVASACSQFFLVFFSGYNPSLSFSYNEIGRNLQIYFIANIRLRGCISEADLKFIFQACVTKRDQVGPALVLHCILLGK
jgi:hypothetical protein